MLDHGQVVGNEQVSQPKLGLQILQQIDHLGLHRYVQGRHRFVADDEFGLDRQGAGNANALALAARKLMRIALGVFGCQTHGF